MVEDWLGDLKVWLAPFLAASGLHELIGLWPASLPTKCITGSEQCIPSGSVQ